MLLYRDNVEWDEEQQRAAERMVEENSRQKVSVEQQSKLDVAQIYFEIVFTCVF